MSWRVTLPHVEEHVGIVEQIRKYAGYVSALVARIQAGSHALLSPIGYVAPQRASDPSVDLITYPVSVVPAQQLQLFFTSMID